VDFKQPVVEKKQTTLATMKRIRRPRMEGISADLHQPCRAQTQA
jgi:hypothetical protein